MDPICIELAYEKHRCKEFNYEGLTYERLIYKE
jgi:hypothetical protein